MRRERFPEAISSAKGAPSEKETLVSRLIDRPIRPLFAAGFKHETQVVATVLSHDLENDPDILAMIAASAALSISGLPFQGPISAARVGYHDGAYVLNPNAEMLNKGALDLVAAGTRDAVLMVESEAKELSEEVMLGAVMFAHRESQPVLEAILRLSEKVGKTPWKTEEASEKEGQDLSSSLRQNYEPRLREAYAVREKNRARGEPFFSTRRRLRPNGKRRRPQRGRGSGSV